MPATLSTTMFLVIAVLSSAYAVILSVSVVLHPVRPASGIPTKALHVHWARVTAPWLVLVWSIVVSAIGVHALLAGWDANILVHGWQSGPSLLPIFIALVLIAQGCLRVGIPKVDPVLTARCRSITERLGIEFRHVKVIGSIFGRKHIGSGVQGRVGGLTLLVCRGLVDLLSPEEIDFMCAYSLARVKLTSGGSGEVAQPVIGPLMISLMYLTFPQISASLKPFWVPMTVYAIAMIVVTVMMDRGLPKGKDLQAQADRIALRTVGRLDIAESCLGKMREFYDASGERELGKDIPNRIGALRETARKLGMDPSVEWVQR